MTNQVTLSQVKQGEVFKRKPDAKTVFVRSHYDRGSKTFSCFDWEDVNREIFLKGTTPVFIDFIF